MSQLIRTTITLPEELYESLKAEAFFQKKTMSSLVQEGISQVISYKKLQAGEGLRKLMGKYAVKGKKGEFVRSRFYDRLIRKEMSS